MIVATIITYNDWPFIKDCINSVNDKVDKLVVIDGRYKDFEGPKPYSSDGTLDWLLDFEVKNKDRMHLLVASGYYEVQKRNLYFNYLEDGDICLNIDADEVLITDLPKLEADIGIIRIGEEGHRRRHRRTIRYFRYRDGLHYWGQHKLILDSGGRTFAWLDRVGKGYRAQDTRVEFLHNNHKRDYNRKKAKRNYYKNLIKREAKINVSIT